MMRILVTTGYIITIRNIVLMEKYQINFTEIQVISLLSEFYKDSDYEELKRLYLTKSFPEILSIDRREMSHSTFLAWLLNKNESHGLADFPIKQFLKILVIRDLKQNVKRHCNDQTSTKKLSIAAINEEIIISEMSVSIERPVLAGNKRGRIDILIVLKAVIDNQERDVHIIIENKVYSNEQADQTKKYFEANKYDIQNNKNSIYLFVFLTPLPKAVLEQLTSPQCSCKEYIQINYQDILDAILEPALKKKLVQETVL